MSDRRLEDVARELYGGSLDDFVPRRNALAKQTGDRDLAAQIKALRKPSIAAWVANVFAQERAGKLGEALQLAEELREAQADLDARALSQLSRERRALTGRLAKEAVALASARGEKVSSSTLQAVQQTITAAFFDPNAAAAVASGRFVHELEPSAGLHLDIAAVVAGGRPDAAAQSTVKKEQPADEVRARRERRDAERTLHAAERSLERAQSEQEKSRRARKEAAARAEDLADQVRELEAELVRAREQADAARAAIESADQREADAENSVRSVEQEVQAARDALRRLNQGG